MIDFMLCAKYSGKYLYIRGIPNYTFAKLERLVSKYLGKEVEIEIGATNLAFCEDARLAYKDRYISWKRLKKFYEENK